MSGPIYMKNKVFKNNQRRIHNSENKGEYVELFCDITKGTIYCFRKFDLFLLTLTKLLLTCANVSISCLFLIIN